MISCVVVFQTANRLPENTEISGNDKIEANRVQCDRTLDESSLSGVQTTSRNTVDIGKKSSKEKRSRDDSFKRADADGVNSSTGEIGLNLHRTADSDQKVCLTESSFRKFIMYYFGILGSEFRQNVNWFGSSTDVE